MIDKNGNESKTIYEAHLLDVNDKLIKALTNSTKKLESVFKNTGSLGCREQAEFNMALLSKLKNT